MKTALITGASRGLGAALAVALAPTHFPLALAPTPNQLTFIVAFAEDVQQFAPNKLKYSAE